MRPDTHQIDFDGLVPEFAEFRMNNNELIHDSRLFVRSLTVPLPRFAQKLLAAGVSANYADKVRELYFFLLEKRYAQRLNLLYFVFDVFDESVLPEEVINQTPFPHEDGIPKYANALEPGFIL